VFFCAPFHKNIESLPSEQWPQWFPPTKLQNKEETLFEKIQSRKVSSNVPVTISVSRWSAKGLKIVITGATKGIGKAFVDKMKKEGALVCQVARDVSGVDVNEFACSADISTEEGRAKVVQTLAASGWNEINCLINNVGTNIRKKSEEYSQSEIKHIIDTNLMSAFQLTRRLLPFLERSSGPRSIVNVSSVAGITAMPSGVVYAVIPARFLLSHSF
jgi:Tropinone reductase 1